MKITTAWTRQRRLLLAFHLLALALAALHLYAGARPATPTPLPALTDPESLWWGVWPATYVPGWLRWAGAAAVLLAVLWGWWASSPHRPDPTEDRWPPSLLWALAALLVGAFWAFPIVHTRWGDAYLLAQGLAWPDPALRLTHSWQAPLDVYLHSRLWHWLHAPFGWEDAVPIYRLLSPIAGLLYLLVVLRLAQMRWLAPNWLTFGFLTSLGLIQLFFGYVENYSFAAAGILAYLWLGLDVIRGERPLWMAATVLALTIAAHPSTLIYLPSLIYLAWHLHRQQPAQGIDRGRNGSLPQTLLQVLLPLLLIGSATFLLMEAGGHGLAALLGEDRPGGGDGRWLVPLLATETRWEHYTMFSWPHLRDILNQQLLVAPVVLPALLLAWIAGRPLAEQAGPQDSQRRKAIRGFLLAAASAHLLLTWIWNPDYGGQRDWDLFSLAAIPTSLLLIEILAHVLPAIRLRRAAVVPLLTLQALHTMAWIHQNRLPWQWPP